MDTFDDALRQSRQHMEDQARSATEAATIASTAQRERGQALAASQQDIAAALALLQGSEGGGTLRIRWSRPAGSYRLPRTIASQRAWRLICHWGPAGPDGSRSACSFEVVLAADGRCYRVQSRHHEDNPTWETSTYDRSGRNPSRVIGTQTPNFRDRDGAVVLQDDQQRPLRQVLADCVARHVAPPLP